MARDSIPACKRMRREGADMNLKSGIRALDSKCKLNVPPGMHGTKKGRASDYNVMLRHKQRIKFEYGLSERQFRNYYHKASKSKGIAGVELLILIERRLDNTVYRMGFASTRAEARQLVSHGAILINGKKVNIPSCLVNAGDTIGIKEKSKGQLRIQAALELSRQRAPLAWLEVDPTAMVGSFKSIPERSDLSPDFKENLVVEFYSK